MSSEKVKKEVDCMKLKELREKKGISQSELARQIGKTSQMINKAENGNANISVDTLLKIINVLDCSADELLGINKK